MKGLIHMYTCIHFPQTLLPSDRKSTRLNSSHQKISYAVFCLKKKISRLVAVHDGAQLANHNSPFFVFTCHIGLLCGATYYTFGSGTSGCLLTLPKSPILVKLSCTV